MSEEDQKRPKVPSRMNRLAWPKAKFGVYIAIVIIVIVLLILYKDFIF